MIPPLPTTESLALYRASREARRHPIRPPAWKLGCLTLFGVIQIWWPSIGFAAESRAPDYLNDVRPILEKRCFSCHSRLQQKGGLRLDAGALIHKGGKEGPVLSLGHSAKSPLIQRLTSTDDSERMPPEGKPLSAEHVEILQRWIDSGATYPKSEPIPSSPADHWSFRPVKRPAVPAVKVPLGARNPVDHFLRADQERAGMKPHPQASPDRLLRRTHLDLTGLPPSLPEHRQFAERAKTVGADTALDEVIDALLTRPAYGERWARHWLDLVRYADSNGYERDAAKPFVWRYRDWVIQALNQDWPYDRFLTAQLAGDEMPDATGDTLIATGMLRLGHWDDEPADPETDRYDQLDDMVSTASQVFLGLTLGCARCHDHKFEPLSTRDYYSMVAVFNPLKRPQNGRTELTSPVGSPAELTRLAQSEADIARLETATQSLRQSLRDRWLKSGESRLPTNALAILALPHDRRDESQRKLASEFLPKLDVELAQTPALKPDAERLASLERDLATARASKPDLSQGYFMQEPAPKAPATHVLIRGNPRRAGTEVTAAVPAVLAPQPPHFPTPSERTSRRRLGLAQWIASAENPLTARVIVNRVWQQHFGVGLVRTPSDFGLMGEPPTHPELLDWLADWFVHEGGWSLKKLHRLLLTSQSWRLERAGPDERDPENRLWTHLPYRRLEAESIRDSILSVSGQLNPRMFGPAMFPQIPDAALEANTDRQSVWKTSPPEERSRRTLYSFIKRGLVVPMLEVFDLCDTVNSTSRRPVTTVAPQALTLFNGEFANEQARHMANRLIREAGPKPADQIDLAFRLALARQPSPAELSSMLRFLETETQPTPVSQERTALDQLCRVVLNLNEFVYPD